MFLNFTFTIFAYIYISMANNGQNIKFIDRAKLVHGGKYDYSKINYLTIKDKVKIICKIHGEFEQTPESHFRGSGCHLCANEGIRISLTKNKESFIIDAIKKHGDKYDYSNVEYINGKTKVKIICSIHGEFEQTPNTHLGGCGCSKCGKDSTSNSKLYTLNEILIKAIEKHGDKYDYSLVNYIGINNKIKIICPEHGEFEQTPAGHIQGHGCLNCGIYKRTNNITKDINNFINESNLIHDNKYDYSLVNYINCKTDIKIICFDHGIFERTPDNHLLGVGCPKCTSIMSKPEREINTFLDSISITGNTSDRKILNGLELDIYIPSNNLAIEFDGLYWHNELHKPNDYHLNKTKECQSNNIQLIHIFEDEWMFKENIVKSRIKNILGLTQNRIYGRKCIIKEVNIKDSKLFLDNNHIQGKVNSSINIGLYYNNELVSLMCFNKPRSGIGSKYDGYELSRFCNKLDTTVIGSASKLLKYFENMYQPKEIKSYADLRWSEGNLYKTLGFELNHINEPNYWYIINNQRKHRFNYRKSLLINEGFDASKTEREIMFERGIYRIYDCGTLSYSKKQLTVLS